MRKIIYYVATSLDGYIAGKNNDISMFAQGGEGVEQYLYDLESYDTVIMGRKTYEFGYEFGLKPGEPAYPKMKHYIFSNTLSFDNPSEQVKVVPTNLDRLIEVRNQPGSDIYLCGGGVFAGWLLENGMIDELKLKINPIILGEGTPLFGNSSESRKLEVLHCKSYDDGLQIITYRMLNN